MIGATNRAKNWRLDCTWRLTGLQAAPEAHMFMNSCRRGWLARAGGSISISRADPGYCAESEASGRSPRGHCPRRGTELSGVVS